METKTGGMVMDEAKDQMEIEYVFCCKIGDEYEYTNFITERMVKGMISNFDKQISEILYDIFNSYYKRGFIVKKEKKISVEEAKGEFNRSNKNS